MNGTQTALAIGTCILACIAVCVIVWKLGYKDGWDARGDHEHSRRATRQLRETRAQDGIRAKTGLAPQDGRPPWSASISIVRGRPALIVPGLPMATLEQQTLFTLPGGYRPAKRVTDTGELRALNAGADLYVSRMQADGEAYRQEMTS